MERCEFCGRTFKNIRGLANHLRSKKINLEDYYNYILKPNHNEGFCEQCGKPTKFESLGYGYKKYCGDPCPDWKFVTKKSRQTMKERTGYEHALQNPESMRKFENTMEKNHGARNAMFCEELVEKQQQSVSRNLGVTSPLKSDVIKRKVMQANFKVRGYFWPTQCPEVRKKLSESWHSKSDEEREAIQKKREETNLEIRGKRYPTQCPQVIQKRDENHIKNYGVKNPMHRPEVREKVRKKLVKKSLPKLKKQWDYLNLQLLSDKYEGAHIKYKWKCIKCGFEFEQNWNAIQQGYLCPKCFPRGNCGFSRFEKEISEFIKSLGLEIKENDKRTIRPLELDIVIENRNIAIEFDGLYWHSDDKIDKNYHLNKTEQCNKKGIRLIHIFEDEWVLKKEIVKSKLKHILNSKPARKIGARKCQVREIDLAIYRKFLSENHLQGKYNSIIRLGLFYKDELVAVMGFSHGSLAKGVKKTNSKVWELDRFCTKVDYHIVGAASKLLSYFKKKYDWKEIFTYADRRWSNGNMYYKLGFKLDSITEPGYWYVKGLDRFHRFSKRKRKDEPKEITESVLRAREGYTKIWDCGNLKFKIKK